MATRTQRVRRNANCPCGSGRKYKKCCLRGDESLRNSQGGWTPANRLRRHFEGRRFNPDSRLVRQSPRRSGRRWQHVFCQVPLQDGDFLVLALAFSSAYLKRHRLEAGGTLSLDLPKIRFSGNAFIMSVQDADEPGVREGNLLLAMEHRSWEEFPILTYGNGSFARNALARRCARSRDVVLVLDKPDGIRVDIGLTRSLNWIATHNAAVGGEIFLDLPEMGARGWARVVAINSCPPFELGDTQGAGGRFVTGTFRHSSGEVYDLKL
ncbi:MAG: SEC-C domain-containing protein [Gemmatimonadales bacterium]